RLGNQFGVADQDHVAAGVQVRIDAGLDAAGGERGGHADVVGEHDAAEMHFVAQDVLDPALGVAGRVGVDLRIDDVGHHHRVGPGVDAGGERHQVELADPVERAVVDRVVDVGVLEHRAVAREMLERGRHAGVVHALHVGAGEGGDDVRVGGEGTIADGTVAAAQVDHGREAEIDSACAHFAGQDRKSTRLNS